MSESKITLRSTHGKQKGGVTLTPVFDKSIGRFKGVRYFSPQEALLQPKIVTGDTSRTIRDGSEFDLNDPIDAIDWAWLKENDCIDDSLEASLKNQPNGLFYIYNPNKDVESKAERNRLVNRATNYVYSLNDDQKREVLMYLGSDPNSLSSLDLENLLIERAKQKPEVLVNIQKDTDFKTRVFLFRLVNTGKVQQDHNGVYRYGDMIMGINKVQAIAWLDDKSNRDLVGRLYSEIYGIENTVVKSSVVDDFNSFKKDANKAGELGKAGEAATVQTKEEDII